MLRNTNVTNATITLADIWQKVNSHLFFTILRWFVIRFTGVMWTFSKTWQSVQKMTTLKICIATCTQWILCTLTTKHLFMKYDRWKKQCLSSLQMSSTKKITDMWQVCHLKGQNGVQRKWKNWRNGSGELSMLTPTFRKRSPTILRADIRAEGVRGVVPLLLGGMPETWKEHKQPLAITEFIFSCTTACPCSMYRQRKVLT